MPEKPEVITVAQTLFPKLVGKKITDCKIKWDRIIAFPDAKNFALQIKDQTIQDIQTRGKFLLVFLDKDCLLIHLRMEGKFLFRKKEEALSKHEHVIFTLNDCTSLRYHDLRKFGKMYLIPKEKIFLQKPLLNLGLEYDDKNLTKAYLFEKLKKRTIPIKTALLDQKIIAGIGNIYADEILFRSRILSTRKSCEIKEEECNQIIENCRIVFQKAITLGGSTIKSFTSSEGVHGRFQNELLVYGKQGQACPKCGRKIQKQKLKGRGTYYCPTCQK